jgi:hypothetical protein
MDLPTPHYCTHCALARFCAGRGVWSVLHIGSAGRHIGAVYLTGISGAPLIPVQGEPTP